MLSYRHAFHAGNFADVFKHQVLVLLVKSLLGKDKPFCYLDTHAGAGLYELYGEMARKNREYEGGIVPLWDQREHAPELVKDYLDIIATFNPSGTLRLYPGSPELVRHSLRPRDRIVLCDLHSTEARLLKTRYQDERQIAVHEMDAYQGLKAFLPPLERRGLVLCDPAFELKDERKHLVDGLLAGWRRWSTGIFAVWYPILDRRASEWLHRQLKRSGISKILVAELRIHNEDVADRLNGTGMIIINPPWQLPEQLDIAGPWLWQTLSPEGKGGFQWEWLVPE